MDLYRGDIQNLIHNNNITYSDVNIEYRSVTTKNFNIEYWIKIDGHMQRILITHEEIELLYDIISKRLEEILVLISNESSRNKLDEIYIGGLWDGNKIEDIIIREFCYRKINFIPVILNYTNDTLETTCFKIFNSNCSLLIHDININADFIEDIKSFLFKEYKTKIFTLSSYELIKESDILDFKKEKYARTHLRNYFNATIGIKCEESEFSRWNYKENIKCSFSKEIEDNFTREMNLFKNQVMRTKEQKFKPKDDYFDRKDINHKELVRYIVYTTGTTGVPKGVKLSYKNFETTIKSIEMLCINGSNKKVTFVITNPLHHINSTCFVDYCIRNSIDLVMFNRYSRDFWTCLSQITNERLINYSDDFSLIVPLVPKHIEYFVSTLKTEYYENKIELIKSLSHSSIYYFFGSSTVSYDFFKSFKELFNGKIPRVRFGSTETCLQVCGTDLYLKDELVEVGFKKGIMNDAQRSNHHRNDGYFIGRSISPFTEVAVVKSIEPISENFLLPCKEYELGYIICRGDNIMNGYIHPEKTLANDGLLNIAKDIQNNDLNCNIHICDKHPWYIGLGDHGFWVRGEDHLENNTKITLSTIGRDECACCQNDIAVDNKWIYWVSRSRYVIKIGGVKYSSEEINKRLRKEILSLYNISPPDDFKTAVMGFKDKERISEDDKIVFFYEKLNGITVKRLQEDLKKLKIPKSYLPCKIIETKIKKNSKGNIDFETMKKLIDS
ncbi:acyl-CoA synthetase [Cryptosporidium ryanae]|uniref:acyl-CoA synthetase n=1 Tax=Cryptosporidium ryanae TaxID=515981 RepID=UPI00351A6758|nr:acyl-CoA synthetase [Cryptosporidium ryanae]